MTKNLKIIWRTNTDWSLVLPVSDASGPVDITGWTALMQVRFHTDTPDPPLAILSTAIPPGGITVDTINRQLVLSCPATQITGYTWRHGVYDLVATTTVGQPVPLLEGEIEIELGVTR